MKDSQRHRITSYGSKGHQGRYDLKTPPPSAHISYKPEMVGSRYGGVTIISPEKRWSESWNHCYVLTQCTDCGNIQWQNLGNLRSGKSKGCQHCSQPRQIPLWLDRRLTAAKQRCENPSDPQYHNYGARGIRFCFYSVTEAGLYLIRTFGLPKRKLEIDRIDNNLGYQPGNIRFATRKQNVGNRRVTVLSEYRPQDWPYSYNVVIRKLSAGETREQIMQDAQKAVREKRKNWRGIQKRLASMTLKMPDQITVLPYRGNSSTTADMAAESER